MKCSKCGNELSQYGSSLSCENCNIIYPVYIQPDENKKVIQIKNIIEITLEEYNEMRDGYLKYKELDKPQYPSTTLQKIEDLKKENQRLQEIIAKIKEVISCQ